MPSFEQRLDRLAEVAVKVGVLATRVAVTVTGLPSDDTCTHRSSLAVWPTANGVVHTSLPLATVPAPLRYSNL